MVDKQKGFTLLELVLSLVLIGIFLMLLDSILLQSCKLYYNFQTQNKLQQEMRTITTFIQEEIKLADRVKLKSTQEAGMRALTPNQKTYKYLTHMTQEIDEKGNITLVLHVKESLKAPNVYSFKEGIYYQNVLLTDLTRYIYLEMNEEAKLLYITCLVEEQIKAEKAKKEITKEEKAKEADNEMTSMLIISMQYK